MQLFSRSNSVIKIYIHMISHSLFVIKFLSKSLTPLKIYILLIYHSLLLPYRTKLAWKLKNEFIKKINKESFTGDWFATNIPKWVYIFKKCNLKTNKPIQILEIGSHEGMSALFLLDLFPNSNITCIDTWEKYSTEGLFDKHLKSYFRRIKKYRIDSFSFLSNHKRKDYYDLVYVDGSHFADDVLFDAIFGFRLLKKNGVLIFDDYLWKNYSKTLNNPAAAINLFLKLKSSSIKIIYVGYQIAIQKK